MAFSTLGSLLPQRLRQNGLERPVQAAAAVHIANQILDEWFGSDTTTTIAQAVSVKQRQICIASLDASMRHELKLREEELIEQINRRSGKLCVERLTVLV